MSAAKDHIYGTAFTLISEGKFPTESLVVERTKRSSNTVHKYMKEFRQEHADRLKELGQGYEPMPDDIKAMFTSIFNMTLSIAQSRFDDQRVRDMEIANNYLNQENERLKLELERAKGDIDRLEKQNQAYLDIITGKSTAKK